MVIREVHVRADIPFYTAVWLDEENGQHRGVFSETELVAVQD
jgi:hypothetical protein